MHALGCGHGEHLTRGVGECAPVVRASARVVVYRARLDEEGRVAIGVRVVLGVAVRHLGQPQDVDVRVGVVVPVDIEDGRPSGVPFLGPIDRQETPVAALGPPVPSGGTADPLLGVKSLVRHVSIQRTRVQREWPCPWHVRHHRHGPVPVGHERGQVASSVEFESLHQHTVLMQAGPSVLRH